MAILWRASIIPFTRAATPAAEAGRWRDDPLRGEFQSDRSGDGDSGRRLRGGGLLPGEGWAAD